MLIWNIIKFIFKNLLAIIAGAIFSLIFTWIFLMKYLLASSIKTDSFGSVLGGIIVFPMLYSFFALIIGGVLGIIVFNVRNALKRKYKHF